MADKQEKGKKTVAAGAWALYEAKGELKRKNKSCPKCGDGTFMAKHKNRYYCGNCHYCEFISSKEQ